MDTRPTNALSYPNTSRLQRGTPLLRLLLVLAAGVALLGLALAVPLSLSADASLQPPTSNLQLPTLRLRSGQASNLQPNAPQASSLLLLADPIVNGGFEEGDLDGWSRSGSADHSEALRDTNFTPNIAPTEGFSMALLCTGPGIVDATNTPQGNLDGNLNGYQAYDTSILSQILNLTSRDVPATLSFDWSFLTSEGTRALDPYDDFFRVKLGNDVILSGSKPGGSSPFPDVALTQLAAQVTSAGSNGSTLNCDFTQGRTAFGTFRYLITDPGTYTLEFLVADEGDRQIDSGLLIDNVRLIPEIDLEINKTATPDPAIAGEPLIYEITVTNHGTGRARDVIVTDTLPIQVDFITDTLPTYVTETLPSGCTFSTGSGPGGEDQLFCDLGDILGGESVSFEIEVDVDADALANGTLALVNTAEVDSEPPDRNLRNNTIILETILQDLADLEVTKVSKPDTSVRAGETFTYTIYVDNLGPSHARNVVLTDTILSSGAFTLVGVTPDPNRPDSCTTASTSGGTVITCQLNESLEPQGDPPRNGRWVIQVAVMANYAQDVDNVVDVFSIDPDGPAGPQTATPDPDTSNNRATDFIAVTDVADLKMTKIGVDPSDGDFEVVAGRTISWTIVVSTTGPSTAENVAVVDILPRGLVEGSVFALADTPAPGGGQCTLGTPGDPNEPLICQLGNLAPYDTATVTIVADVDPSYVADQPNTEFANYLPNDAYLTSDTFDPETQNNIVYDALVEITAEADLAVQKSDRPDFVIAGEQLEYTLTISNAGPSTAEDVVLLDQLPDALTAIQVNVVNEPDATCSLRTTPANIIDCGFGNILPEKTITMVVTSLVRPNTPAGTITNTVSVTSVTSDTVLSNNINITATTDVETQADVEITKTSTPDKVYAGEQKKYTITVHNIGPSDAQTVTVTDTLPLSLTYEIDTDHCALISTNPDVLECRYGRQVGPDFVYEPLPPSGTWQFDIWARVDPALVPGTTITNTAVVTGTTTLGDPNLVNNTDTAKNLVLQKADLKITKFGKPDGQVRAGELLTYTLIVDNLGPSYAGVDDRDPVAGNVAVKDILQSDLEFDLLGIISDREMMCSSVPTDGDPTDGVPNITQHLEVDCTLRDALEVLAADGPPNSGRWIITMTVTADETQDLNNVAHVVSDAFDPNPDNNQAEVMHEITDVADLEVTKTEQGWITTDGCPPGMALQDNQVTAGLSLTYTLVITNHGPSTAENVVLQDRLPSWIVVTGVETSQGNCDTGTPGEPLDKLTCGLGTLLRGDSATITIEADVPSWVPESTILENDAFVYSDIFDDTNANNYATNLTEVSAFADLWGIKTDNPDPVVAGELLEYTVTITNSGPSDAIGVVVSDTLDANVTFLSIRDPFRHGVTCSLNPIDEHTLTCALGDIPAGDEVTFMILVLVNPDAPAALDNLVSVSSDTADPCPDNNDFEEGTGVDREQQLFVVKSDSPDPVLAGTELRYTITFGNNGPSEATNTHVTDTLPLGVFFDRCESLDPNDRVTCELVSGDGITMTQVISVVEILDNNISVYTDTGKIEVGDSFTFLLIASVESGYILNDRRDTGEGEICRPFFDASGYPYFAHNHADISADLLEGDVVVGQATDRDDECTRVDAEADLEITKTDDTGGFLHGDPMARGGIITYTLTVANNGPSDAAQVVVVDWLPPEGIALDPAAVSVTILDGRGEVEEIRDDGRITILAGNDPDEEGVNQPGRINAGSEAVTIYIEVIVTQDAECGMTLTNEASVETRRNDTLWPPVPEAAVAPTLTEDPDLTNNTAREETMVVCPEITIHKTVSLDGTCPGTEYVALGFPYQPVTLCYEVVNTGDTYLDNIIVTDAVFTPLGPVVYTFPPITYVSDPHVPMAPGESKMLSREVMIDCHDQLDVARVTAEPVNRGRTRLASVPVVYDEDPAYVEAPCEGVDWRILLPTLQTRREEIMARNLEGGDLVTTLSVGPESLLQVVSCETWLQIQNVGNEFTKAAVVIWGDPGPCAPQSHGPVKVECTGLLRPGSAWTFTNDLLPEGARSAIVYSLNATDTVENWRGNELLFADLACKVLGRSIVGNEQEWEFFDYAYRNRDVYAAPPEFPAIVESIDELDFGAHSGEPLAVVVDRTCPGDNEPGVKVNAAYVGISADLEGLYDPVAGGYAYYAPLVWATYGAPPDDMNSLIHIQNAGGQCASVEIWLQAQDDCLRPVIGDILALAPGESYAFDPNTVVGPGWQGSAWIASSQPLGIVVDLIGRDLLGAYYGVPANVHALDFSHGTLVNYAPLIYREYQGWETGIQVQNLSSTANAKVKVYFLDASGGVITTVTDWICPRGSQTFYLPVISDLPGSYVGSARIESLDWWTPGDPPVPGPMILSVVNIIKYAGVTGPSLEMVTYNALQERGAFDWQVGGTYPGTGLLGVPLAAKENRGLTTELAVQNLNPNPGFTDFVLYVYDQNRLLDVVCEKLNEKQVEYINFDAWGFVRPGFLGSIVISATHSQQQGGAALGAVAVERVRRTLTEPDIPGDESKAFEAFPLYNRFLVEDQPECP